MFSYGMVFRITAHDMAALARAWHMPTWKPDIAGIPSEKLVTNDKGQVPVPVLRCDLARAQGFGPCSTSCPRH